PDADRQLARREQWPGLSRQSEFPDERHVARHAHRHHQRSRPYRRRSRTHRGREQRAGAVDRRDQRHPPGGDYALRAPCDDAVAGTFATTQGFSVTIAADGSFDYTPGFEFNGTDSFAYTVRDAGLDGDFSTLADNLTDTATATINVSGMAWFIDNNAGGSSNI